MILHVNTNAHSPAAALVADKPESAPSVPPEFVYGDNLSIDLYLVDGDGNYDPRSGDGSNTIRFALGPIGGTIIAYQASWSPIANGFRGTVDLNTVEGDTLLGALTEITTILEIEIIEASALAQTIVQTPVLLRREIIPTTPNAPTPVEDYTTTSVLNKSFVQNRFSLTGLTGGGATSLDGIVTAGNVVETGTMVAVVISGTVYLYRLENSTDAENSPTRIRPDDYNNPANARVWHLTTTGQASTQLANTVLAGPTTGAAAIPTFRALVAADLPAHVHAAGDVTSGVLSTARLGTGTATAAKFLRGDGTWSDTIDGGDLKFDDAGNGLSWTAGAEFVRRKSGSADIEIGTGSTVRATIGTNFNIAGLTASTLLRADSSKNLAAVTIGTGLTFDGVTLAATGGASDTIGGSGTSGVISKFTGTNSIGDSLISDDGTDITFGTAQLKLGAGKGLSWDTATEFVRRAAAADEIEIGSGSSVRLKVGTNINFPDRTASKILRTDGSKNLAEVTIGTGLSFDGTTLACTVSGTGTVTSVALSAPTQFSVTGSPVTTSGTLALTWANQTANKVFSGPISGGADIPTFRSLIAADLGSGAAGANNFLRGDLTFSTSLLYQSADNTGPGLRLQKRGTTGDANAAVAAGVSLGSYVWDGWDGAAFGVSAFVNAFTTEGFTALGWGSKLQFATTKNGSTTAAIRMLIDHDGKTTITPVSPTNGLQITGAGGTSPSIRLLAGSNPVNLGYRDGTGKFVISTGTDITANELLTLERSSGFLYIPGNAHFADLIGIGNGIPLDATAPFYPLHIMHSGAGSGGDGKLQVEVNSTTVVPSIGMSRSRGTSNAKAAISSADVLGSIHWQGFISSISFRTPATIDAIATENHGASGSGTKLQFSTTPNAATSPVVGLTLDHDGKLNVPGLAASSLLRTDSSKNLAAVTVGSGLSFDGTTLSATGVPGSHTHDAGDITTGVLSSARLGTGSASVLTFLRGDNTWRKTGRTLFKSTAQNGSSGTSLTTLTSYVIPAQTLAEDGESIRIRSSGNFASNGNNKHIEISYAGYTIFTMADVAYNGGYWVADTELIRAGASTIHCSTTVVVTDGSGGNSKALCLSAAAGASQGSDQTFSVLGQGGASSDVQQLSMTAVFETAVI